MCLGVPGRILSVDGPIALVDFFGVRREIRLDIVDSPVAPGDYILNHVGYAIRRIPDAEIAATVELYETLLEAARAEDEANGETTDLMAADVRSEIEAAGRAPGGPAGGRDV